MDKEASYLREQGKERRGNFRVFREHERRKLPSYPEEAFYSGNMERPGKTSR